MSRHFGGRPVGGQDKTWLWIFSGFFVLAVVVLLAFVYLKSEDPQAAPTTVVIQKEPEREMVEVLVPLRDIPASTPLQPSMFKKERRLQISVDERVVKDFEAVIGAYSRTLLVAGNPLHADFITNVRPTTAISANIPVGYRAVAIRVNATSSVEGWAKAGSKVDVHWTTTVRGAPSLVTIVQNAKVLSAERQVQANSQPGAPVPSTITLLVSAQDAQKISLAESTTGQLSLSLRGDSDAGKAEGSGGSVTIDDLLGTKPQGPRIPNTKGTVTMGGKKWLVGEDGSLLPLNKEQ